MNIFEITLVLLLPCSLTCFLKSSNIEIITRYDTVLLIYKTEVAVYNDRFNYVLNFLVKRNRPIITINEHTKTSHLHVLFSPIFLSIVFLSNNDNLKKVLADNIRHIRQSHVIVFMPKNYNQEGLFLYLWKQRIINVAAVEDTSEIIWTYTNFPDFKISTKKTFTFETTRNFNGSSLRIMWGDIEPRTNRYINRKGELIIGGYSGAVIPLFAEVYNLKLVEAVSIGINTIIYADEMEYYIKNDTIDLATAVKYGMEFSNQSYPLETFKWCVILPIDYDMKIHNYYGMIFRKRMWIMVLFTFVLNSLVLYMIFKKYKTNASVWTIFATTYRSMLGEAFDVKTPLSSVRFYYVNMNLQGVLVTIFYVSLLSSIFVRMPMKNQINTYEELYESELKVWVYRSEWEKFLKLTIPDTKYYKSFEIMDDYQKIVFERDNFNLSQGYTMSSDKWRTTSILQDMMSRPKFMFTDICFLDIAMLSYPIDDNSIYKEHFNKFIFDVKEYGFISYFHSRSLLENVESGRISLYDNSTDHLTRILRLEDMEIFFIGYLGFLFVSIIILTIEIKMKSQCF